jgi:hypothetical protein
MPLFPTLCTVKKFYSVVHSETDFRLLNVKEPSIRRPRTSTRLNSVLSFYKPGEFTQGNGTMAISEFFSIFICTVHNIVALYSETVASLTLV